VIAMAVMTKGLWATVYIEPTHEAITAERRGYVLVFIACALLAMGAITAFLALGAPLWVSLAVAGPIVVCGGLTMTPAPAIIAVVVAYPLALAGLVGGLFLSR